MSNFFFFFFSVEAARLVSSTAMASANVSLENQLHSAQKNLLFLQQDHANTLKGLHAEIRRLQQQCTGERRRDLPHLSAQHTEEQTEGFKEPNKQSASEELEQQTLTA